MANKLPSVVQSGNNQYLTPALSFNRVATDTIVPGVIGTVSNTAGVAPMTGAFAVNAQGSPNMTVAVTGGVLYAGATPSGGTAQVLGVTQDVSENVTIASNATGSTRYDFIYMSLDSTKLNNPASNGLDVCTLTTSRSTTPYNAATAGSFGNSNGAQANTLLLAVVTVVNGAVSIGNSSITDARVQASDSLPLTYRPVGAQTNGSSTTTATSYTTALADTIVTSITVNVPTTGTVLVLFSAYAANSVAAGATYLSFSASGANTIAAGANASNETIYNAPNNSFGHVTGQVLLTGLTPGSTVFTLNYKVSANTGTYQGRHITVVPL